MTDLATVKKLIDELGSDYNKLNDVVAKQNEDVSKHGNVLGDTKEHLEKINSSIDTLKASIDETEQAYKKRHDDFEKKLNRMTISGVRGDEVTNVEACAREFWAAKARPGEVVDTVSDEQVDQYRSYCAAFSRYARKGEGAGGIDGDQIRAELSVGIDSDGGYWVPAQRSATILQKLYDTSPMRQFASQMTISTDVFEQPLDTNDATLGGWVGEKAARAESATPAIGLQKIPVHEQYAEPHATQKILDDAIVDVEAWLGNKISDKLDRTENTAFVTGTGIEKPTGFLDYGSASVTTVDASRAWGVLQRRNVGGTSFQTLSGKTADDIAPLINLQHDLKGVFRRNASWAMNRGTLGTVRLLRNNDGTPYWQPSLIPGMPDTLLGHPIAEFDDMPDIASDAFAIAFGDFAAGYLVIDRFGVRILRDPFTSKPFVKFYTIKRTGGDVSNFDAIKLLKFAA